MTNNWKIVDRVFRDIFYQFNWILFFTVFIRNVEKLIKLKAHGSSSNRGKNDRLEISNEEKSWQFWRALVVVARASEYSA